METINGYYLTVQEVCNILKVTETTVYLWISTGKIKAIKFGKLWRIPESELKREDLNKD
jgi:excisionase family DNA binding protein